MVGPDMKYIINNRSLSWGVPAENRQMTIKYVGNEGHGFRFYDQSGFDLESPKQFAFAFLFHDWLKKLAPLSQPIRNWSVPNRDSLALIFPRFASARCNSRFDWLTGLSVSFVIGWSEYNTQLKTCLSVGTYYFNWFPPMTRRIDNVLLLIGWSALRKFCDQIRTTFDLTRGSSL